MIPVRDSTGADKYLQSKTNASNEHITGHGIYGQDQEGNPIALKATENGVMGVGNGMKKFRDGFVNGIDPLIWDKAWTNPGDSFDVRGGDTAGSAYWKISLSPLTPNSEYELISKETFQFPFNFIAALSMSQRILAQEVGIYLVGCNEAGVIQVGAAIADMEILGTVTVASNTATFNLVLPHNLHGGDRVIIKNCEERRLNVGPVVVTILSPTSISVPCTLANGTYNAGGFVEWADQVKRANNAVGVLYENTNTGQGSFFSRRNGASIRSLINQALNSTVATQSNTSGYSDAFNSSSHFELIANMREVMVVPRAADSVAASGVPLKLTQGIPDENDYYKIVVRVKNFRNLTRPVAKIVSITKTGTTTATVVTDVPHNLMPASFVQLYGVRDQVSFPNLTAQTQVASIVDATTFTIVIGAALTVSSAGGGVWEVQGSVLAPGVFAQVIQSISRTANVLTLIGNGNWATPIPGETFSVYGCDATSMGLYDGAYKVLRVSTTTLELESVGADFASINCGGAVIRRTDVRIHFIHQLEYTRHVVELANQHGANDLSRAIGALILNNPAVAQSGTWNVGVNAGLNRLGFLAASGIWYDDSSTNLAANASFNGTARDLTVTATATAFANAGTYANELVVSAESDVAGTLWLEVSRDGAAWRRVKSVAMVAVPGGGFFAEIIHKPSWRHARAGYTNGATAQARFSLGSILKAI
jgi:hypothetical protein